MQIYLDMDGVLADFDAYATRVLGMRPSDFEARYGAKRFWREVSSTPDFYAELPPMPDMEALVEAVEHLDPIILTGVPRGGWAAEQKDRWRQKHLPDLRMITCFAREKSNYCRPGDLLIDDRPKYEPLWRAAGGVWNTHKSVESSIRELKALEVIG